MTEPTTEAAVIAELAQQAAIPANLASGEIYASMADGEIRVFDTDGYAFEPRRNTSAPVLRDAASLIEYVQHATDSDPDNVAGLEAYADLDHHRYVVIFDGWSGWRGHRATLQLVNSPEWLDWLRISGRFMGQVAFAEFLEDHISSIADPDGADLLALVNTLVGTSKVSWTGGENTSTGSRRLGYAETVEAKGGRKGDIEVPATLTLALRPFMGSDRFSVKATIRYRMDQGELQLAAKVLEPDATLETAFTDVGNALDAGLPCTIMAGQA